MGPLLVKFTASSMRETMEKARENLLFRCVTTMKSFWVKSL